MKKHNLIINLALAFGCVVLASEARAQEATHMPSSHAVTLDAGFESAFVARLGYAYRGDFFGEDSRVYARFALPAVAPDLGDFAIDAGARMHLLGHEGWGVQALAGPLLRHTENHMFAATALGFRAAVLPGYQTERWGLMLDVGLDQILATQIEHSSFYKETFYADAKSGWYALSGGALHAGLRGGVRIGKLELSATAGVMTDAALQPMLPPFYFTLGSAYAL